MPCSSHTHDSAAAHALHHKIHKQNQEAEHQCKTDDILQPYAVACILLSSLHSGVNQPLSQLVAALHPDGDILHARPVTFRTFLCPEIHLTSAYSDFLYLSILQRLDKLAVRHLLAASFSSQIVSHLKNADKGYECRYQNDEHRLSLTTTRYLTVALVIVVLHKFQFSYLCLMAVLCHILLL